MKAHCKEIHRIADAIYYTYAVEDGRVIRVQLSPGTQTVYYQLQGADNRFHAWKEANGYVSIEDVLSTFGVQIANTPALPAPRNLWDMLNQQNA